MTTKKKAKREKTDTELADYVCIGVPMGFLSIPERQRIASALRVGAAIEGAYIEGYMDGRRGSSHHQNDREYTTCEGAWHISDTRATLKPLIADERGKS